MEVTRNSDEEMRNGQKKSFNWKLEGNNRLASSRRWWKQDIL